MAGTYGLLKADYYLTIKERNEPGVPLTPAATKKAYIKQKSKQFSHANIE